MTYKNQNLIRNFLLKEEADKYQKDYVDPNQQEEQQEQQQEDDSKLIYSFTSYSDAEKTEEWGTGTVEVTGVESNGYSQVKILTNSTDKSFEGQTVYIISTAQTNGTAYPLYSDAGTTALGIYVTIEQQSKDDSSSTNEK